MTTDHTVKQRRGDDSWTETKTTTCDSGGLKSVTEDISDRDASQMTEGQYQALNTRRDTFNNLLWQTPVLSLTAQAFLFTIVLSNDVTEPARMLASALAVIASLGSLQLLAKHRFMEVQHAKLLRSCETAHKWYPANRQLRADSRFVRFPSYWVWTAVLWAFFIAAAVSIPLSLCGWLHT
jgi:hypothetical protein